MEEDFGFSFTDSESTKIETQDEVLEKVYNIIMPFLNALKKDPDKKTIVWDNRIEVIDNIIEKLYNVKN